MFACEWREEAQVFWSFSLFGMDTKGRLVAGSHNRNEFVVINADDVGRVSALKTFHHHVVSWVPCLKWVVLGVTVFMNNVVNFF